VSKAPRYFDLIKVTGMRSFYSSGSLMTAGSSSSDSASPFSSSSSSLSSSFGSRGGIVLPMTRMLQSANQVCGHVRSRGRRDVQSALLPLSALPCHPTATIPIVIGPQGASRAPLVEGDPRRRLHTQCLSASSLFSQARSRYPSRATALRTSCIVPRAESPSAQVAT
jgi:hypothetical protein